MFDALRRTQLVKKGLASGKKRRRQPSNEILRSLEHTPGMKVAIFAAFIAGLAVLIFSGSSAERAPHSDFEEPTKRFVIALLFFVTAVVQLWINQPRTSSGTPASFLVFGIIFVQLAITKLLIVLCNSGLFVLLQPATAWVIAPYAFAPLVLCVLLGRNHGLYGAVFVSLWSSILAIKMDAPMLVNGMISGFTAVYLTLQVRRRSRLIRAGLFVGLAICLLSLSFGLIGPINLFNPGATDWTLIGLQCALAIGNGMVTAMLVGGALPIWSTYFKSPPTSPGSKRRI